MPCEPPLEGGGKKKKKLKRRVYLLEPRPSVAETLRVTVSLTAYVFGLSNLFSYST